MTTPSDMLARAAVTRARVEYQDLFVHGTSMGEPRPEFDGAGGYPQRRYQKQQRGPASTKIIDCRVTDPLDQRRVHRDISIAEAEYPHHQATLSARFAVKRSFWCLMDISVSAGSDDRSGSVTAEASQ
jgi:hypothetical protein